jgi:acetyl-CoA synthetase
MPDISITSMMEEKRVFNPPQEFSKKAYIKSLDEYKKVYKRSVDDPEGFWGEMAQQLDWYKKWNKVLVEDFGKAKHAWYTGGKINVSYNCVDRHCKTARRNKAAIIWQGEPLGESRTLTYQQLYYEVNRCANALKKLGIKKETSLLYLPMIPS